ncbi:30S ribosomal protein S19 [Candidatus Micrarchaeota archaeon]|nr:30S ribosomal protein S19 [Candidatus Micrarchaeota archaeon]
MVKKEFTYRGKTMDELKKLSIDEFAAILPSRKRRTLKRGMKEQHKTLLKQIREHEGHKPIRTHIRDMIILPEMIGKKLAIHNGKDWISVDLPPQSVGHVIGEFALTRKKVSHSGPGIGATRGTKFTSVK